MHSTSKMSIPPFFPSYSYKKYNNYYKKNYQNNTHDKNNNNNNSNNKCKDTDKQKETEINIKKIKPEPANDYSNINSPLFEILGVKIYFDDILIVLILLFLYQEGIQDEYLFISLILLLLS